MLRFESELHYLSDYELTDTNEAKDRTTDIGEIKSNQKIGQTSMQTQETDEPVEEAAEIAELNLSRLQRLFGSDKDVKRAVSIVREDLHQLTSYHEEDILADYLNQAGNYVTLTTSEVEDLYSAIASGIDILNKLSDDQIGSISKEDRKKLIDATIAHQTMIVKNLRFVVMRAAEKNKFPDLLPLPDLIDEGNIGLIRAISKFDVRRGFTFTTYATRWIDLFLSRGINQKARMIYLPEIPNNEANELWETTNELTQLLGREPTIDELVEVSGLTEEDIRTYKIFGTYRLPSLDAPIQSSDANEFNTPTTLLEVLDSDRIQPGMEDAIGLMHYHQQVEQILNNPLSKLSNKEKIFICMQYGFPLSPFRELEFKKRDGTSVSCEQIEQRRPTSGIYPPGLIAEIFGYTRSRASFIGKILLMRLADANQAQSEIIFKQ